MSLTNGQLQTQASAYLLPVIILLLSAPRPKHKVDCARATKDLAPRLYDDLAIELLLRSGRERPVVIGVA